MDSNKFTHLTLSDEELNKKLSVELGLAKNGKVLSFYQKPAFNFCGKWEILMPLVENLGISLLSYKGSNDPCVAQYQTFDIPLLIETSNINTKRALAECCLLVIQQNNK